MTVGVVTQLNDYNGTVVKCTMAEKCKAAQYQGSLVEHKQCLLAVDHGSRCKAWDIEQSTWLIHPDPNQIQQL